MFLMDWILKGKVPFGAKILDAGSGVGRNLSYFLNGDVDVNNVIFRNNGVPTTGGIRGGGYEDAQHI